MEDESTKSITDCPNEILLRIFEDAENPTNLSLVSKQFNEISASLKQKNKKLKVASLFLMNPDFDFDAILSESTRIDVFSNALDHTNFGSKLAIFLQSFGDRVVNFSHYNAFDFNVTEFLPLLGKMETYYCCSPHVEMPVMKNFTPHSVPLKALRVMLGPAKIFWETLEVFDVAWLEMTRDASEDTSCLEFIAGMKNLKKFQIDDSAGIPMLLKVLSEKKLESVDLNLSGFESEEIENFIMAEAHSLETVKFRSVDSLILKTLCESLTCLEELNIDLPENLEKNQFFELSKLKSLKTLAITSTSQKTFEYSALLQLPSLKSLTIHSNVAITIENVQELAAAFSNLDSLNLKISSKLYHDILPEVLKIFNHLEELSFKTYEGGNEDENQTDAAKIEEFYSQSHRNENLKELLLDFGSFDPSQLLQKIFANFPNLEVYPLSFYDIFSSLQVDMSEKKLRAFNIDPGDVENIKKLIADGCRIFFSDTEAKATRNEKGVIDLNLRLYFNWCHIRSILNSPRKKIDTLDIQFSGYESEEKVGLNFIHENWESITKLIVRRKITSTHLKAIIEMLPNLAEITFVNLNVVKEDEEVVMLDNSSVKSVMMYYQMQSGEDHPGRFLRHFAKFCQFFWFPNNCLTYFYLEAALDMLFSSFMYKSMVPQLLGNQMQLMSSGYRSTMGPVYSIELSATGFADDSEDEQEGQEEQEEEEGQDQA